MHYRQHLVAMHGQELIHRISKLNSHYGIEVHKPLFYGIGAFPEQQTLLKGGVGVDSQQSIKLGV